jgi:hypothetical protein
MNEIEIYQDKDIKVIEQKTPSIITEAKSIQIDTEQKSKHANDLLSACKKMFNIAEDKRKFFVKPLNDHIKNINDEFKKLTSPLKEAESILKEKLLKYISKVKIIAQEKEKEKEAALADLDDFTGEKPEVEEVKIRVESGLGMSFTKKVWRWKVIDEAKIPREYFLLDEKKINALIKAHARTVKGISICDLKIDGIEIFQEDEIAIRV